MTKRTAENTIVDWQNTLPELIEAGTSELRFWRSVKLFEELTQSQSVDEASLALWDCWVLDQARHTVPLTEELFREDMEFARASIQSGDYDESELRFARFIVG
jgi:hypothetical protein